MLLKIFKYDMKSVSWNLGLLHLSLFVLILVARGFENILPILSDILYFIFGVVLVISQFMVHISFIKRFKARTFEKESYVYHSLPVTVDSLMLSHTLGYVIWGLINQVVLFVVILFTGMVIDPGSIDWSDFQILFNQVPGQAWVLLIIGLILEFVWFSTWAQLATTIANHFPNHDRLVLVIEYIVCFFVMLFVWMRSTLWYTERLDQIFNATKAQIWSYVLHYGWIVCAVVALLALINYFSARYLLTKHTDIV
jgi:hypothetical protein